MREVEVNWTCNECGSVCLLGDLFAYPTDWQHCFDNRDVCDVCIEEGKGKLGYETRPPLDDSTEDGTERWRLTARGVQALQSGEGL